VKGIATAKEDIRTATLTGRDIRMGPGIAVRGLEVELDLAAAVQVDRAAGSGGERTAGTDLLRFGQVAALEHGG